MKYTARQLKTAKRKNKVAEIPDCWPESLVATFATKSREHIDKAMRRSVEGIRAEWPRHMGHAVGKGSSL